jgi:hypothetical protein
VGAIEMTVLVDLSALLLTPRHHAVVCIQQLQLDGVNVEVFSGLPKEITQQILRANNFHLFVDDVVYERDYGKTWINVVGGLNYAAFISSSTRLRRLTLPVQLSYG